MLTIRTLAVLLASTAGLAVPATAADVITVDPTAGQGDFQFMQDAINAAADGDVILVRPGNHNFILNSATVDDKTLVIVGDTGGPVIVSNFEVRNINAEGHVVFRNLTIDPPSGSTLTGGNLFISDCAGTILVEDCQITGFDAPPFFIPITPDAGARVLNSNGVSFTRCTLLGGDGADTESTPMFDSPIATAGAAGLLVENSTVIVHESTLVGGDGGNDLIFGNGGKNGGAGLAQDGASVYVAGSSMEGGDGGLGCSVPQQATQCHGGDGARVDGAASLLRTLDSSAAAGSGGGGAPGGTAFDIVAGVHVSLPGIPRRLEMSAPLRESVQGTLSLEGEAGDVFGIFLSFTPELVPLSGIKGAFLPELPFVGPIIVVLPGPGPLDLPFFGPALTPASVDGILNMAQAFVQQASGGIGLSSPTAFIGIADAF